MQHLFRLYTLLMLLLAGASVKAATPTISDSIDIRHFTIRLDITDYEDNTISGNTEVDIKMKVDNMTMLPLDLLGLTVDSVKDNAGNTLSFTHIGEQLEIQLPVVMNTGDSTKITVYYQGVPDKDLSWGGWYWSGDYAYQMGVGFDAIPHNFGRVWFPCFDNFIERSTFRYEIITTSDKKAYCGGLLESETDNGDGTKTWVWNCVQSIPSYLASVAVSTYTSYTDTYAGIEREIPIEIAVKPEDLSDLESSFINLHGALSAYENNYGAYSWDRVGYAVVPFSGGAMEHAMNIAYPLFAVTGTLTWETLYAHELSHHWWGDLVTCSTPQEMWLNEGWAVFSEHLFTEAIYGDVAYMEAVKANAVDVLHYAAARDGNNYFAISNVPESNTYGATTYNKGAAVVHTLRGYMGDELFFSCVTSFLNAHKFQAISAAILRDYLSECSGIDLTNFFNDWVYQPGSLAVEVDDIGQNVSGISSICLEQKKSHADNFGNGIPLSIFFMDNNGFLVDSMEIEMSGEKMMFEIPFPTLAGSYNVVIDYRNKLNDAVTSDELQLTEPGITTLNNAFMSVDVNSIAAPRYLYVEHYWVAADNFKTAHPGLHVNTERYWRVINNFTEADDIEANFNFNGQATLSGGYLDNTFITNSDDSLVLLHRANQTEEWEIYPYATINTFGSTTDKRGTFDLTKLLPGEYCFGIYDSEIPDQPLYVNIFCPNFGDIENTIPVNLQLIPNPADSQLLVQVSENCVGYQLVMLDLNGKIVYQNRITTPKTSISTEGFPAGTYQLYVENPHSVRIAAEKVVIIH
jgi:aminopeptidase N